MKHILAVLQYSLFCAFRISDLLHLCSFYSNNIAMIKTSGSFTALNKNVQVCLIISEITNINQVPRLQPN